MLMNEYVVEKLRDLDEERLPQSELKRGRADLHGGVRTGKPVIGPVMRVAGRTLRRAGEGLEGWGTQGTPESEQRWAERHTG